jgi:lipoprotein-releasing system permease protein
MVVVALVTMAMVVVLSAFNGIDALIDERFSYFDADITVLPSNNRVFSPDTIDLDGLKNTKGISQVSEVIEERVFARYDGNQRIAKIKGVSDRFLEQAGMDTMLIEGISSLSLEGKPAAIIGIGVKYDLDLRLFEQQFNPLSLSAVLRGKNLRTNMESALNKALIPVVGVFSINIDFDSEYILVPIDFAADLLGYENEISAIELRLDDPERIQDVKRDLQTRFGPGYTFRTRFEKNEIIYKTNRTEKWATFLIMGFIMLIATFNIIAALTLLINEKRHDIKILAGMGANTSTIKRIFFYEGALINMTGATLGIILGFAFVYLQQNFGLVRLEGGLVEFYPVKIAWKDLLAIFSLVIVCGVLSSIAPVQFFTRKYANV